MANKNYKTANDAIKAINKKADELLNRVPSEFGNDFSEKLIKLVKQNRDEAIASIESDRNSKFPSFDRIVNWFLSIEDTFNRTIKRMSR